MRFELPAVKRPVHRMEIPIRWGDMDAMRHVNNAAYFRYFETVRIEWMHAIGAAPDPAGEGPLIVNAFCNFIRPLEFPGTVIATHFVGAVGRSSLDTYMTLERSDAPGVVVADGGATVVWVNSASGRSAPLPDWFRALVE